MIKKIIFLSITLILLASIIFLVSINEPSSSNLLIKKDIINNKEPEDKIIMKKETEPSDGLRNALENVVQDSIEKDIQDAVQAEIEKAQK
ncbi:MAG: hypothetical protein KAG28_10340 [Cocleimonas sp.]|nr:hypothetical protein [Cocleimonas sp.]